MHMAMYQFTCTECGQEIAVNDQMRKATLDHGCPVCSATVEPSNFVIQ